MATVYVLNRQLFYLLFIATVVLTFIQLRVNRLDWEQMGIDEWFKEIEENYIFILEVMAKSILEILERSKQIQLEILERSKQIQ